MLLTEAISNMLLRKRRIQGDVPLGVVGLRSLILIRLEDFTGETGIGKEFRYDTQEGAIEVAYLTMARIEIREAKVGREGGDLLRANDELEFGTEVEREVVGEGGGEGDIGERGMGRGVARAGDAVDEP
ncbi:hypothetical protein K469DRAFT_93886 [Zopfia rhizophila CBS 207.26]|uniref:Uncharacterized protein n=1 Tax=Zopfia rhizophila CBS 207.26 TaxID=1314779 RepID=A0A6A6EDY5_9PEZI|nr:hypothetical protein K469DRAFT_93886 [Zopfia rhizophila CBS 207.26]